MQAAPAKGYFRNYWKQIIILALLLYVAASVFVIGGDGFIMNLNTTLTIVLVVSIMLSALAFWRETSIDDPHRLIWAGLAAGYLCWSIGELWWGFAGIFQSEVAYPSWADLSWIIGYFFFYFALWQRIRGLPRVGSIGQAIAMLVSSMVLVGAVALFILPPIVQSFDRADWAASVLNILYPIADIVIIILVLRIFSAYQQGMYWRAWAWLLAGFAVLAFSDLMFAYASTANLYYPDGKLNLISTLAVDIPYNLGYLLQLIAFILLRTMDKGLQPSSETVPVLPLLPNTHLLVLTNGDDSVIQLSQNFSKVFPLETGLGKTFAEALGLQPEDAERLLHDIKSNKVLKEQPVMVSTFFGQQQARISGVAVITPEGKYSGVSLLVRLFTDGGSLDGLLTDYHKGIVQFLSTKADIAEDDEVKRLLFDYYQPYFKAFYNRLLDEGGTIWAKAYLSELEAAAKSHGWRNYFHSDSIHEADILPLSEFKDALAFLLATAKQFVAQTIDPATVNAIVQTVTARFDEDSLNNISYFMVEEAESLA